MSNFSNEYLIAKIGVDRAENEPLTIRLTFKLRDSIYAAPPISHAAVDDQASLMPPDFCRPIPIGDQECFSISATHLTIRVSANARPALCG